jgi:hypothetical protein
MGHVLAKHQVQVAPAMPSAALVLPGLDGTFYQAEAPASSPLAHQSITPRGIPGNPAIPWRHGT